MPKVTLSKQSIVDNIVFVLGTVVFLVATVIRAFRDPLGYTADEQYHYDIIKLYAKQWSPFIRQQSAASVATVNDVTRYPSYLFHYLMSFPYRVLQAMHLSDHASLIGLRLVDVALGLLTLFLLRKLLGKIASRQTANVATALFAILPVTSLDFGGLNYDDLLLPTVFVSLLVALSLQKRPTAAKAMLLLAVLELGTLVKYSFLPFAAAGFVYLTVTLVQHKSHFLSKRAWRLSIISVLCAILLVLGTGLFLERYGVNLVRYKNFKPLCSSIHPQSVCLTFPINARNYAAQTAPVKHTGNVAYYAVKYWYKDMVRGLVFPYLWLFWRYAIFAVTLIALLAIAVERKLGYTNKQFGRYVIGAALFYLLLLYYTNYASYLSLGQPYAINGRYLLPVLPLLAVVAYENIVALIRRMLQKHTV